MCFYSLVEALKTSPELPHKKAIYPSIGEIAPEIAMPGRNGDTILLSDLRGSVVLVDFWASWCRPCRVENHWIYKIHKQFKNEVFTNGQGFKVFSVSLDTDSLRWTKAISNDRLDWPYHVSDFQKWETPAAQDYNIKYLPKNLLLDKNGVVIAKGVFREKLAQKLESYLAE